MADSTVKSGDHLKDLDVTIVLRSSAVRVSDLNEIKQVIVTSVLSGLDTSLKTVKEELKVTTTSNRRLSVITVELRLD